MRTSQEIMDWVEEEEARALENLRGETNHNNNHLATAYGAEYEMCQRLREFITGG